MRVAMGMKKEPQQWARALSEEGALSEGHWRAILGEKEWLLLEPCMRQAFLACDQPAGKAFLAKAFKGHLISRMNQGSPDAAARNPFMDAMAAAFSSPESAQEKKEIAKDEAGWSGALGERARIDCLAALARQGCEPALSAGAELLKNIKPAALAKRRGWGSYATDLSLIEALCHGAGARARAEPKSLDLIERCARSWARLLAPATEGAAPKAPLLAIAGALEGERSPSLEGARAAFELAARSADWFAEPNPPAEASGAFGELDLADRMRELVSRCCNRTLTPEATEALEEGWDRMSRAGGFKGVSPDQDLLVGLMKWACRPEAAEGSVRLAERAVSLGLAPEDGFERLAERALEQGQQCGLPSHSAEENHGVAAWIRKLCEAGMDPCRVDEDGVSLLCVINERAKSAHKCSRPTLALERAAAELLAQGADPALIVPRLDPVEQAATGALRGMLVAAMERRSIEAESATPLARAKKRPAGI